LVDSKIDQKLNSVSLSSEIVCDKTSKSTLAGKFEGNSEYYSHLEITSSRSLESIGSHQYDPIYTGKNIDCYIIDTGVRADHPLLQRVYEIEDFKSGYRVNYKDNSNEDDNGHGTEIALFISGKGCGIASDSNIIPLKVIGKNGSGDNLSIAIAIDAVIGHHLNKKTKNPSIINYSLGMLPSPDDPNYYPDNTGGDVVTLDALKLATTFGIHVVAAAGNGFGSGSDFYGPMMSTFSNGSMNHTSEASGNYDSGQGNPIIIGSTNAKSGLKIYSEYEPNKMAEFSNYGLGNTINAPGSNMIIPRYDWKTENDKRFRWRSGTSFSCPIVVGILCLFLEESPSSSVSVAKQWLVDNATKNAIDNLMMKISVSNSKLIYKQNSNEIYINLDFFVDDKFTECKYLQIDGVDSATRMGVDGWYDIIEIDGSVLKIRQKEVAQFDEELELDNANISFLDNTHQHKDGVIKWQSEDNKRLILHESDSIDKFISIKTVEETANLIAFNTFIKSNFFFDNQFGIVSEHPEGFQEIAIKNAKNLITDVDIGLNPVFSFLFFDNSTETKRLKRTLEKDGKFYYSLNIEKDIVSFYRGNKLTEVKNSKMIQSRLNFSNSLKNKCNQTQLELLSYFETIEKDSNVKKYIFNKEFVPSESVSKFNIYELNSEDFKHGTLRINKPGYYFLSENIDFHPNPDNEFMPTPEQIGNGTYPVGKGGAYHLGFFAAITIETSNVILDLNGFTIQQTKMHNLFQRFFSIIELANAPFIPSQGPHSFGDNYKPAETALIMNGFLGSSSHHGIHGNLANNIIIDNLEITNFEVAGIALNGTSNAVLSNIKVEGIFSKIPVISPFSQAVFIRRHLREIVRKSNSSILTMPSCGHTKQNLPHKTKFETKLAETESVDSSLSIFIQKREYSIENILGDLERDIENAKTDIMNNKPVSNYFSNTHGFYDGNVYGIVLHVAGVVVHDFIDNRDDAVGNDNILLTNIEIKNITSRPEEILTIQDKDKKIQSGPFGDVLDLVRTTRETNGKCTYSGNSLSNAQLFLIKYENSKTDEHNKIIEWAEGKMNFTDLLEKENFKLVVNKDSMAHTMKGNIGLFLSGAINSSFDNIKIEGVKTLGKLIADNDILNSIGFKNENRTYRGADSNGVVINASENLKFTNISINDISSETEIANVCKIKIKSSGKLNGIEESCKMETEGEYKIELDENMCCINNNKIKIGFEYRNETESPIKILFSIYSDNGYETQYRHDVIGSGFIEKEFEYNKNNKPNHVIAFMTHKNWEDKIGVSKVLFSECSSVSVNNAVNYVDDLLDLEIDYDVGEEKSMLVINTYSDNEYLNTTKLKDLSGNGTVKKQIDIKKLKKIPNKIVAFVTKTNWQEKIGSHKLNVSKSVPLKTDETKICMGIDELETELEYDLHEDYDIVLNLYKGNKYLRSKRIKSVSGKGKLNQKIKIKDIEQPDRLVAFVTKKDWSERIGKVPVKDMAVCGPGESIEVVSENMCLYENTFEGKFKFDNLEEDLDLVVDFYSDAGYEQSFRKNKIKGDGVVEENIKMRKNFKPTRMVAYLTSNGWNERKVLHKIDSVVECQILATDDKMSGESLHVVACTEDVRICKGGEVVVRDPRNNCEFPLCKDSDMLVCSADVIQCKNGKYVGKNPLDECNWYPCDDSVGILPIDDDASDIVCPMDVRFCRDGGAVSRVPENNCEFAKCPEDLLPPEDGEVDEPKACTKDLKVCRNGEFVARNPFDDCKFYDCDGDNTILPIDDDARVCAKDIRMCPDGKFVTRDPANDCKFRECSIGIMNGIHLNSIVVTGEMGSPNVQISVSLLEGTTKWQYQIEDGDEFTETTSEITIELSEGVYKIKLWGVDDEMNQVGRIFYEKIYVDGGDVSLPIEGTDADDADSKYKIFLENMKKFKSKNYKTYSFKFERSFFGLPGWLRPVHIFVEDGKMKNIMIKTHEYDEFDNLPLYDDFMTMQELFDHIDKLYTSENKIIDIEFDKETGYIKRAFLDDRDQMIVDNEMTWLISEFKPNDIVGDFDQALCTSNEIDVVVENKMYKFFPRVQVFEEDGGQDKSTEKLTLSVGEYTLRNIPHDHAFTIQSSDSIEISPLNENPIVINVSGGSFDKPHYKFELDGKDISNELSSGEFAFMVEQDYIFTTDGVSSSHPFSINVSRSETTRWITKSNFTNTIKFRIPKDHSTGLVYYCERHSVMNGTLTVLKKSYKMDENTWSRELNYYYGDVSVLVNKPFDDTNYECFYHGYMGGENGVQFNRWCGFIDLNNLSDEEHDHDDDIICDRICKDGTSGCTCPEDDYDKDYPTDKDAYDKDYPTDKDDYIKPPFEGEMQTLNVDGHVREFLVHIPTHTDTVATEGEGMPLILNFHGFDGNAGDHMMYTKMNDLADVEKFVVVYPQAVSMAFESEGKESGIQWNVPNEDGKPDDIAFVDGIINKMEIDHKIDRNSVYVTGFSNGGMFAFSVATHMKDVIKGVANVCGTSLTDAVEGVSVLSIHGNRDEVVSFEANTIRVWAEANSFEIDLDFESPEKYANDNVSIEIHLLEMNHEWKEGADIIGGKSINKYIYDFFMSPHIIEEDEPIDIELPPVIPPSPSPEKEVYLPNS
jgi:subtilisin family serine protease/predicted esterase